MTWSKHLHTRTLANCYVQCVCVCVCVRACVCVCVCAIVKRYLRTSIVLRLLHCSTLQYIWHFYLRLLALSLPSILVISLRSHWLYLAFCSKSYRTSVICRFKSCYINTTPSVKVFVHIFTRSNKNVQYMHEPHKHYTQFDGNESEV